MAVPGLNFAGIEADLRWWFSCLSWFGGRY